eukprot:CAMPEP_0198225666 /NCGR_PEP_ID=MMETSP1445-20131203/102100_1 /TAXON_ID=36898 /ORGANISM="Pyramimonas sp., Strain CCMP2087" /LENGTH=355 /DNA_ID=CAMNT_0043905261 /DNA_START=79 /DNA_END=1143 /DNA_ORIENTATION=+
MDLRKAIKSNSSELVEECLATGSDANTVYTWSDGITMEWDEEEEEETEGKPELGSKFTGLGGGRGAIVPALHHAVRNCLDNFGDLTTSISEYTARHARATNAMNIIVQLISHGADVTKRASFRCLNLPGYKWIFIHKLSALEFAANLKEYPERCYAEEQCSMLDNVIKVLRTAQRQAGHLAPPMTRVATATRDAWHSLLFSPKYSDVSLETEGELLPAHKNILAASSDYFDRLFSGSFQESDTCVVKISKNANIMRVVLKFIYTGNLDQDALANNHLELLDAAHEYLLPQLQRICRQGCIRSLSGENLAHTLGAAQLYGDNALKNACFDYVCRNATKVLVLPSMLKLSTELPEVW